MTGAVRLVTDATFADVVLGSALPCLVEFREDAIGVDSLDRLTSFAVTNSDVTCARLDVSTSPHTPRTYGVGTFPTYLVFRLGAVVSTAASLEDLPAVLATLASTPVDDAPRLVDRTPAPS